MKIKSEITFEGACSSNEYPMLMMHEGRVSEGGNENWRGVVAWFVTENTGVVVLGNGIISNGQLVKSYANDGWWKPWFGTIVLKLES